MDYDKLYNSICRICLNYKNRVEMVSLLDGNKENGLSCFGKAVLTFANIVLDPSDCLPAVMCKHCLLLLKSAIYFKLQCESNDQKLKNLFSFIGDKNPRKYREKLIEYTMLFHYLPCSVPCKNDINSTSNKSKEIVKCEKKIEVKIEVEDSNEIREIDDNFHENSYCEIDDIGNMNVDEFLDLLSHYYDNKNSEEQVQISSNKKLNYVRKNMPEIPIIFCNKTEDLPHKIITLDINVSPKKTKKLTKINTTSDQIIDPSKPIIKNFRKIKPMKPKRVSVKRDHICNVCQKVLSNRHTYTYHMQLHDGWNYICDHCGRGYGDRVLLRTHLASKHGVGPYFQCEHCPFKAAHKPQMTVHVRKHTGERPYTCEHCGLTFRTQYVWKKHQVYHTTKNIQCLYCPKKFYRTHEMKVHVNSVHERSFMYICSECDITFAKTDTVRKHLTAIHHIPREMQGKITRVNVRQ